MKVLIVRFSSIGDIVLTTPVIRGVKKQLNAEVHVLTKKAFAPVLVANPYIDRLWLMNEKIEELLTPFGRKSSITSSISTTTCARPS